MIDAQCPLLTARNEAGGIGGVVLSSWLLNTVIALIGTGVPRLIETRLDVGVLATL